MMVDSLPQMQRATSDGTSNAELAHARLQSSALHTEKSGGALRTGNAPLGLAKSAQDVLAVGFFKSGNRRVCGSQRGKRRGWIIRNRDKVRFEFGERNAELLAARKQNSALEKILQFPNVARPRVTCEGVHGFGGNVFDGFVQTTAELLNEVANEERN